jgi:hypothetical protein
MSQVWKSSLGKLYNCNIQQKTTIYILEEMIRARSLQETLKGFYFKDP